MTIQQYEPPPVDAAPVVHTTQVTDLVSWVEQAQAAHQLATMLCGTAAVSQQYRGKPDEAAAAILCGGELGFSPMASLRGLFDNIQGVTAPRAITQRAVVQSRGHDIWLVESTATRAVVQGQRKGSDKVQESVWTIERAQGLNLLGKDNWKKQPAAMLVARATSECARLVASDALLGIPYSAEELRDDAGLTEPHPDAQRALPRAARRGATTVSTADLTGDAVVDVSDQPQAMTSGQGKRIVTAFKAAGVSDRAARARVVDSLTDRPISGPADLTADEADALLRDLADMTGEEITALAEAPQQTPVEWPEVQAPADEDGGDQ